MKNKNSVRFFFPGRAPLRLAPGASASAWTTLLLWAALLLWPGEARYADEVFLHPSRVEAPAVYTRARVRLEAQELREEKLYQRDRSLGLDLEAALGEHFSLSTILGRGLHEKSGVEPYRRNERLNLGLKLVDWTQAAGVLWGFGGGLKLFDKRGVTQAKQEEVNPDVYIARLQVLGAARQGPWQAVLELSWQSETNTRFRENPEQEFRRHYQAGLALSWEFRPGRIFFLETEYREPVYRDVDEGVRFWRFYPGLRWDLDGGHVLSFSLAAAARREEEIDRGIRISYLYFLR